MKNHNIIYETTNNINGKLYRGYHSTNNLNDGYLGSGSLILSAIKKYGKENFTRVTLAEASSVEEMYNLEMIFVDLDFTNREDTYNLMTGGQGCSSHSEETRHKMSESSKGKGQPHTEETKDKMSKSRYRYYENNDHTMLGKTHSDESRKKMSDGGKGKVLSEEHKQSLSVSLSGEGCFWYGKNLSDKHKEKLRKQTLGRRWMRRDGVQSQVKASEVQKRIDEGWEFGMNPKNPKIINKET